MDSDSIINNILNIAIIVVVIIGIVGNVLSYIVFSRPTFRKSSTSIYCRALAIFDSLIIYDAFLQFYIVLYNYFVFVYSDAMCKIFTYMIYAFGALPGWILIAMSIDKVLGLRKLTHEKKRLLIHYMILTGIVLFNLLLYIEILIYMRLVDMDLNGIPNTICDISTLSFGKAISIIYIIQGNVLPFIVLFGSSLYTIKLLRGSRRNVRMIGRVAERRKSRETKFAVTSFTFNVLFIVLRMPVFITSTIGLNNVSPFILSIANLLYVVDFSDSFFVHFASNSVFRRELFILLRIRKSAVGSTGNQNNQNHTN